MAELNQSLSSYPPCLENITNTLINSRAPSGSSDSVTGKLCTRTRSVTPEQKWRAAWTGFEWFYSSDKSSLIPCVLYLVFLLQNSAAAGKGGAQIPLL